MAVSRERVFSSTVMILLTLFAVLNELAFLFVLMALIIGGLYEFFVLIKKKGIPIYSYTGLLIGSLIPLSIYFKFQPTKGWELFFIVFLLLTVFVLQFQRKDNKNAIVGISTTLFGVMYVSWFFSFLVKIRFMLPGVEGLKLLGFILIVTKVGDMGALIVGSSFGKHPLLPRISPNKTIEGGMGSFLSSAIAALCAINLLPVQCGFVWWQVALIGLLFGGLGQLGDLSESLIKRDFEVKDSGKMLPGLGGVLDAIDSLLFAAPVFYFFMRHMLKV